MKSSKHTKAADLANLKKLSVEKLSKEYIAHWNIMRRLRFAHALNPLKNPMYIRQTRKRIAQLQTLINQKRTQ